MYLPKNSDLLWLDYSGKHPEPLEGRVEVVDVAVDPRHHAAPAHEAVRHEQVELLVESGSAKEVHHTTFVTNLNSLF